MSSYKLPVKQYKSAVRGVLTSDKLVGGESGLPFMSLESGSNSKPSVSIEILMNIPNNYPKVLTEAWDKCLDNCINNPVQWAIEAVKTGIDFLTVKFNISDENNVENEVKKACLLLDEVQNAVDIPLILTGTGKREIDPLLFTELAKIALRPCIIGPIDEDTYKAVIPVLKEFSHTVIARTPIDINLAKELNILITELGFDADRILIDPNMGGLGYGLDYGYSVIERIRQAGLDGDTMLNMPVVTFVGEEAWKAKETRSDAFSDNWGELNTRAVLWETMTASSVMAAGSNLLIMRHPDAVRNIKNFTGQEGKQ